MELAILALEACVGALEGQPYDCRACTQRAIRDPRAAPGDYPDRAVYYGLCRDCWQVATWLYGRVIVPAWHLGRRAAPVPAAPKQRGRGARATAPAQPAMQL